MAALNPLGYSLLWKPHKTKPEVIFLFVVFTLMIAAGYVVLWFFWNGKNWARLLVLLNCFLCLYNLRYLSVSGNLVENVMLVGEAAVAAFLLRYLNTREAKAFFRSSNSRKAVASE